VKEFAPPIPFERIKRFLDADGVLVNMISGVDIALETLDEIRMAVRGEGTKIHLDVHNLTLGVGQEGERIRRPVVAWRRWAFMVDTVQMNAEEIAGLTGETQTEQQTAGHLLTLGVKSVAITRGAGGATLYWNEHKKVIRKDLAPASGGAPSEVIGAGDVFGAALLAAYVRSGDLQASAEAAVLAASQEAIRGAS
jgi:fructose-1-phosphate kinase PfkB-like protein